MGFRCDICGLLTLSKYHYKCYCCENWVIVCRECRGPFGFLVSDMNDYVLCIECKRDQKIKVILNER